jgi:hypothetical protein
MKSYLAEVFVIGSVLVALSACGRTERNSPSQASASIGGSSTVRDDAKLPTTGGTGGTGSVEVPSTGGGGGVGGTIIDEPGGSPGEVPTDSGVSPDYVPDFIQFDTTACHARSAEPCLPPDDTLAKIAQRCREAYTIECGEFAALTDALGCITQAHVAISGEVDGAWCLYKELQALGPLCGGAHGLDSPVSGGRFLPACYLSH